MKKAVFLASLSVIYSNLLGMQNNMPQDDNIQKNNKKHVRFGKDSIILIDSDRLTEKHVTILQSRRSIIERFIQEVCSGKKDINSQNEDKDSALTLACNYCFYNKAHSLIDLGIDVNLTNSDGHTALMYVAMNGEISLLEKILERGAVVTKQDNKGNTPLLCAMKSPTIQDEGIRLKIVKTLINKDLNTIDQINSQGETALSIAKNKGLTEIEELLRTIIEIKDDFWNTFEREDKEKILQLIRNNPNLCKAKNERGESPLIVATWKNYKDIIEILLQNHTDVNGTTEDGVTSLMYAAYQCNKPLVDLLLRYHADVMLQDKSGNSALHWAMNFNNLDEHKRLRVVQTLVQSNPNIINLKNLYGETALTLSESGHFKLILDFLNKYVVKSEFAEGITEKEENSKPLKEFSPYIYDPKFRWEDDVVENSFLKAVRSGDVLTVKKELKDHVDLVNCVDNGGWTALHTVAYKKCKGREEKKRNLEIAKLLMEYGADVNAKTNDKFESTPLHLAVTTGNKQIAKLIESYLKTDLNKTKENNVPSVPYNENLKERGDIEKENFEEDTFEENKTEEKLPKDNVEQSLLDLSEKEQREIINKDITNKLYQDNFALLQQNEYLLERNAFLEWQLRNLVAKTRYEYNQGFYQKDVPLEIDENGFYVYNYDDIYPVEEIIQQQTYETDTHREETSKPQKDKDSREKKVPLTTGYDINGDIKPGKIILQRGQTLEDIKESIEEGGLIKEPISEKGTGEPKPNVEETASSPESAEESYEITKIVSEENQNLKEEEETLVSEQPSENESRNTDKPEDSSEGMNVLSGIWEIWPSNTNSDNQLSYNKNDAALRTSTEIRQNSLDSVESLYSQQIQSRENTEPLSIEWVKQRIDEGLINDAVDESGNTLLHVAVTNNNIEIIEFLLKNNADLNIKNEVGNTALHNAVMQENLSIVSLLLEHKAKPNLGNQGGTSPLMLAANIGNLNILKTLIEHGSQVNATNHDKNNALMIAVLSKNCNLSAKYNMAVTLLTADLSIINQVNSEGETAQSIAKSRKFENINKLIMEAQNRLKQINDTKRKKQAEKRLNKINEQKKQADNTEKTELMSAKSIMEKGEEPKSKNSTIELTDNPKKEEVVTQVSEAIDRTSEVSKETTKIENLSNSINDTSVENIQEKKTKTSTDLKSFWKNLKNNYKKFFDTKDSNGNSTMQRAKNKKESKIQATLKEAILSNNDELITELLRGDKELLNTSIDEAGNTPLLLALAKNHLDAIDTIMNYDDDIDFTHQNKDGKTAFILAAENKNIDTLNMIIDERRPGVNIADKDGNTPLIIMLKSDNYDIAKTTTYKLLVKYHGVDVNHKNKNGETALIVALKQNRLEIAALLLKNPNLRLDVTNEEGNTQLNLAMDVFQKTLESQYSESQDDLVQKTLNVLAELKKGDIEKANQLITANFKDLEGNREFDLEILNSFRKALLAL